MKIKTLLQVGNKILKNANLDAKILLMHALNLQEEQFFLKREQLASNNKVAIYLLLLKKRQKHIPVAKIVGFKEFYGLNFKTNFETLDPRPDSETLISAVMENFAPRDNLKILELGVGTGCLIITLLTLFENASGYAIDISSNALKVATENAKSHKVLSRLKLQKSNWFENLNEKNFDIIISNPPYICENQHLGKDVLFDPHPALFAKNNGLSAYEEILKIAHHFLKENGRLFLEIGFGQKKDIIKLAKNFIYEKAYKDLSNITRCIVFKKTLSNQ